MHVIIIITVYLMTPNKEQHHAEARRLLSLVVWALEGVLGFGGPRGAFTLCCQQDLVANGFLSRGQFPGGRGGALPGQLHQVLGQTAG